MQAYLLMILFAVTLTLGLFHILADILKLPRHATQKAMQEAGRQEKKTVKNIETAMHHMAVRLSRFIRMNEYRRLRLHNTLVAAGLNMTPEVYQAHAILKSGLIALLAIPVLKLIPIVSPLIIFAAILTYFKESGRADKLLEAKRDRIERELPRFVATVEQEIKSNRDILAILENFKRHAGGVFVQEIDVLTADMRSSSYEAALTRFEARINSPTLSDVVRGLIGVLRGDDGIAYFQMLAHDLKQLELQRLKAEAMKIPPKIRKFSFLMLMCFLATYLVIIVYEIATNLSGMF